MPDAPKTTPSLTITRLSPAATPPLAAESDAVVCDRCGGANVYRMHAVWRCADCGFKTDCCGW